LEQRVQLASAIHRRKIIESTHMGFSYENLRDRAAPRNPHHFLAPRLILVNANLVNGNTLLRKQALGHHAEGATAR